MGISNFPSQSGLNKPPKVIKNIFSDGAASIDILANESAILAASGALTATEWKEILAVSGAGLLEFCAVRTADTTSRTVGLKVVIDGVEVFNATTGAITSTGFGTMAVGHQRTTNSSMDAFPAPFNSSLSVSIKSSITETDKLNSLLKYRTS